MTTTLTHSQLPEQTRAFLDLLRTKSPDAVLFRVKHGKGMRNTDSLDKAALEATDCYFTVHPGGRENKDISQVVALFIDVDAKDFLPGGRYEGKVCLDANGSVPLPDFGLEPTAIVRSGSGGYHAYWVLKEPMEADKGLYEQYQLGMAAQYYGDPAIKDLARIMRLPGSMNHKASPATPCELVSFNPELLYDLSDLVSHYKLDVKAPIGTKVSKGSKAPKSDTLYAHLNSLPQSERLGACLEAVKQAPDGDRNTLLNKAAYWLASQGIPQDMVGTELTNAASGAGLEETEIATTIQSAYEGFKAKGRGASKAQLLWEDFETIFGSSVFYNARTAMPTVEVEMCDLDVLRVRYIEATGKDISRDRFANEFMCWVKTYKAGDPDKDYLDSLPAMSKEEAYKVFQDLQEVMGLKDNHDLSVLIRHRIGRVARTYKPGCEMQWVLVLVGDPGCGKSSYFKSYGATDADTYAVGARGFSLGSPDKDEWLCMLQATVVVMDELDEVAKRGFSNLKGLLSSTHHKLRSPYERGALNQPFRFVWSATANPEDPLQDDGAGLRRYAVVKLEGSETDGQRRAKYYQENRDLINGAAKALYEAGETWNLTEAERAIQAERRENHVNRSLAYDKALAGLQAISKRWEGLESVRGLHIDQVYELFKPVNRELFNHEKNDVQKALRESGWVSYQLKREGCRAKLWVPGAYSVDQVVGRVWCLDTEGLRGEVNKPPYPVQHI